MAIGHVFSMALGQYHCGMESKPPQDTESRHADKYIVRFPDGMRDRLKEEAKANNRTLNAEIVARLEGSFAVTAFPARDQQELDAMMDISLAQLDFHMAQNRVAETRDEFSRARMRYDALVIQENASRHSDPSADYLADMKSQRLTALEEAERAHLRLKEAESALYAAQKKLTNSHVARLRKSTNKPSP